MSDLRFRKLTLFPAAIFFWTLLMFTAAGPRAASAVELQWEMLRELNINETILDVAVSPDEQWMYILTPGKILAFSAVANGIVKQIPVDTAIDRIFHTPKDNALLLSSAKEKKIQIVRIDHVYPMTLQDRPFMGNEHAPVTISIFSHYECPYCARITPKLEELLKQYPEKIRIVFKSFPSYQGPARKASAAAIAAFRQKKFWELHHALHEAEKPLADGKIEEIADSLKLDMAKFLKDLEDAGLQKIIDDDIKEGLEARVYSVPTFFINGKEIKNEKLNDIYAIIDSELERLTKAK